MAPIQPRLAELPEELVSNISIKLGSDDVFALRLTCRVLEQRSFHEFATEYFSQKAIMLNTPSLKVLLHIAESKKLRSYLHHIYIVPALFSDRVFKCVHGGSCGWQPTVRQTEAMHGYIEDQKSLKRTGRDLEMLTDAFSKLPAHRGLTFTDNWRSIPKTVDRCGLASSLRKTNNSPTVIPQYPNDKDYYMWKHHVWKTMLRAIANSGVSTLTTINTDLDDMKNPLCPENLGLTAKTHNGLRKCLRNLKELNLQVTSHSHFQISEDVDTVKGAQVMQRLAGIIPSIEKLDLDCSYSPSSGILSQNFTQNLNLSALARFKLSKTHIDDHSLYITIAKLVNLKDLQFSVVNLTEGWWTTILKAIPKLHKLTHLHLLYLEEATLPVAFRKPLEEEEANQDAPPLPDDFFGGFGDEDDEDDEDFGDDSDEDYDDDDIPALEEASGLTNIVPDGDPYPDSDTDGSMPELEPLVVTGAYSGQQAPPTQPVVPPEQTHTTHNHHGPTDNHHLPYPFAPDVEHDVKIGRYICLTGHEEILREIPTFIKEYNILEDDPDDLDIPAAAAAAMGAGGGGAPPPDFNAFLNTIGAAFGMGPATNVTGNAQAGAATFVGHMPPPAGVGANAPAGGAPPPVGVPPAPAPNANTAGGQAGAGAENGGDESGWTDEE